MATRQRAARGVRDIQRAAALDHRLTRALELRGGVCLREARPAAPPDPPEPELPPAPWEPPEEDWEDDLTQDDEFPDTFGGDDDDDDGDGDDEEGDDDDDDGDDDDDDGPGPDGPKPPPILKIPDGPPAPPWSAETSDQGCNISGDDRTPLAGLMFLLLAGLGLRSRRRR